MQSRVGVPARRHDDLAVTETTDEVLVYDKQRHQIHHLNRTSAVVWRLCDGDRSVEDLVRAAQPILGDGVDEDIVRDALDKLKQADLLDGDLPIGIAMPVHSRRVVMRRVAIAGAVAAITSVTLPAAVGATGCTVSDACNNAGQSCRYCSGGVYVPGQCENNNKGNPKFICAPV